MLCRETIKLLLSLLVTSQALTVLLDTFLDKIKLFFKMCTYSHNDPFVLLSKDSNFDLITKFSTGRIVKRSTVVYC